MSRTHTGEQIQEEMSRLSKRSPTFLETFSDRATRMLIRSLRVITGFLILLFALYCGGVGYEQLATPFAAQSLLGVFGGLFMAFITLMALGIAWNTAFGVGPDLDERERILRSKAIESLDAKYRNSQ